MHVHTYIVLPANQTAQMSDRRSGRDTHVHTSLPTRPHRWHITGQGETHSTHIPAYQTAQMADHRSGRDTQYTHPCLPDRTDGRSPVRERHTVHTSLPTRPHRWQIAGQGETHTYTHPCLPDRTDGRSPVRERHTYTRTHIPAYQTPQMEDRRSGRDPHVHTSLPTRPHRWQSGRDTHTHVHTSLPTRPHRWQIAGQKGMGLTHLHTHPCLLYMYIPNGCMYCYSPSSVLQTVAGFDGLVV